MGIRAYMASAWEGLSNYLHAAKEEVVSEWDEFQEEINQTSSYEQSIASDVLQQSMNGVSFGVEAVGSLINNQSTRELASKTIEEIADSTAYKEVSQAINEASSEISKETEHYLDAHPKLRAKLQEINHAIDDKIDQGVDAIKELASEHAEALRNIEAVGGLAATVIPAAKGARLLASGEKRLSNAFVLTTEENKAVFDEKILPRLKRDYDFSTQENPTLYFTGGLPGSGKGGIVENIQENNKPKIIVADPDVFRKYHPSIAKIQEIFGPDASQITHPDASIWAKRTLDEALENQADLIKDGTLNNAENFITLAGKAKEKDYEVDVRIKAVNEYESLEGVFGRYASQYTEKPHEARFVPPGYVIEGKAKIEETAELIGQLSGVEKFKIINRDHELIYDKSIHLGQSPKEMMQEATDLKNYSKERREALEQKWDTTIERLQEIGAPKYVQQSAKEIRHNLAKELHPIKARVMTQDNAIVAGGAAAYIGADKLQESIDSPQYEQQIDTVTPNSSEAVFDTNSIDYSKYLPESVRSGDTYSSDLSQDSYESEIPNLRSAYDNGLPDSVNTLFEERGWGAPEAGYDLQNDRGMDIE